MTPSTARQIQLVAARLVTPAGSTVVKLQQPAWMVRLHEH
jgi:hypothetical protein